MPDLSDDMLMALADDQLYGPDAEALRQRIKVDAALSARFAVFVESRAAVQAAFAPGETPQWMADAIRRVALVDAPAGAEVLTFRRKIGAAPLLALAASLLLAVGVGGFLGGRSLAPVTMLVDPAALAAAALAEMGTGAETALAGGGSARIIGSYQTDQGLCRLINLDLPDKRAERAVVCRDAAEAWVVTAAIAAGQAEAYIPASDNAAAVLDQVLDDLGAGPALDATAEAAAIASD